MKEFREAKSRIRISPGESVRIIRELQEFSQNELAAVTGYPSQLFLRLSGGRVNLGVERAKVLATALRCHPAVLVFPNWDIESEIAA